MWAKILAGAVAALAVGGTGIFYATHDHCGTCPLSGKTEWQPIGADFSTAECGCCMSRMEGAAADSPASQSLAACVGPSALISTSNAKVSAAACCTE